MQGAEVRCMDNFATGHRHNIEPFLSHPNFELLEADIRDLKACQKACHSRQIVFHQAALGSVPRSIKDPATSNEVNISGFLNMLIAARDAGVKRFVYAASSSTYGDSENLPKVEDKIGKPLSPYAITKYVNELYADVFARTYNFDSIGLRYFNVFGRRQDPQGAYAAVIPKWVMQLMDHEPIIINGKGGEYSRDFTYIDNVVQANIKAALATEKNCHKSSLQRCFWRSHHTKRSVAVATRNISWIRLRNCKNRYRTWPPYRQGDIPHSLASIDKARRLLNYNPQYNLKQGLTEACKWYWENLRN